MSNELFEVFFWPLPAILLLNQNCQNDNRHSSKKCHFYWFSECLRILMRKVDFFMIEASQKSAFSSQNFRIESNYFVLMKHTASEPSGRVNSMNKHFWLQNTKIYHKNNENASLHEAIIYQPTRANFWMIFLFLCHLKIGASWLVNAFAQAGIFGKVAFFIIFMVYFNILKSKVLIHWIEPTTRFGRCVYMLWIQPNKAITNVCILFFIRSSYCEYSTLWSLIVVLYKYFHRKSKLKV